MNNYKVLKGLSEVSDDYDAYLVSVFGVLHDRNSIMRDSIECLNKLSDLGKTVVLLTNAPKRTKTLIQQLSQMGIPPSLYQHIVSAGEETYQALSDKKDPWHATLGDYCYYLGSSDHDDIIDDLNVFPVNDMNRANFILAVGFDSWHENIKYYEEILKAGVANRLPMVCANPDRFIFDDGKKFMRAGYLAARYEEFGGQVRYHGKPYQKFYDKALQKLSRFDRSRILAIGDGLETDILGATLAGLKSAFIMSGLHQTKAEFTNAPQEVMDNLKSAFDMLKLEPNYVLPSFAWNTQRT